MVGPKQPRNRVFRGVSKALQRVANWFEGAVWWSRERSWLPELPPRDARFDIDQMSLREMIRKCRYFAKNNPLCDRITDLFEQYTVGATGLEMVPATSDPKFNANVKAAWLEWCEAPDATSGKDYATLSGEGANALCPDGNFLIVKSFETVPAKPGQPSKQPRVQLVEVHRLQTPDGRTGDSTIHQGLQLNSRGKVAGYWIADGLDGTKTNYHNAEDVIHVFKSKRPGQYFGLPIFSSAINKIHDLDDLSVLQMRKAKQNARIGNILKRKGGEFPTDEDAQRRLDSTTTDNSEGTEQTTSRLRGYQEAIGGEWIALNTDEDITQTRSESPSVTEQWHWEKVEKEICATAGISRNMVFPESMQGTVARADLEISAATLRAWSHLQAKAWIKVYLWWLDWAVQNDPRLKNPPTDYKKVDYRAPRGPNVDVGWNSQAVISELDSGLRTFSGTYAELSQDWMPQLRQRAIERRYIKDLAKEFDLDEEEVVKLPDAVLKAMAAEKAADSSNVPASANAGNENRRP